jgi:hypothetical protein
MSDAITIHDGYVGWGFIPSLTHGDAPKNLTYPPERVDVFNNLTSDEKISLWLHDWNHSWYTGEHGPSVWTKSLKQQREALNHTIWTFYNNFGYYPPVFSAGGSRGNTDTTVVLSERDILLLYGGSQYEPPDERLRYLTLPSSQDSVLFGLDYYDHENILEDMKKTFTDNYDKDNVCLLQIMLHPSGWNETTIPVFAEFTEWVYTNHNLTNMNYTDAYNYKHDLECLQLDKHDDGYYSISYFDAYDPFEITWNEPGDWIVTYANDTTYGTLNVTSHSDTSILQPGFEYVIRSTSYSSDLDEDKIDSTDTIKQDDQIPFTNILLILLITSLVIYSLFKASRRKR